MKLNGLYDFKQLVQALQGNFGCTDITKNSHGKELDDKFVRLELFFLAFEVHYTQVKRVVISRISEDKGIKRYDTLLTLRGE